MAGGIILLLVGVTGWLFQLMKQTDGNGCPGVFGNGEDSDKVERNLCCRRRQPKRRENDMRGGRASQRESRGGGGGVGRREAGDGVSDGVMIDSHGVILEEDEEDDVQLETMTNRARR
eukprot:GHVS01006434.1.p1 GENE.GHVS01006434.1~~GHVS01006434.1.p1  ORF type:complete len:118 (-),score=28.92 GHVS01006434.1:287-640(-)